MEDGQSYPLPSRCQLCHCLPIVDVLYEIIGETRWTEIGVRQARPMLTDIRQGGH